MAKEAAGSEKDGVLEALLSELNGDNPEALIKFSEYQKSDAQFFEKVAVAHEFLDLLTFKIKESKSTMNKEMLADFSLTFLRQTIRQFGYNPKFIATQAKALITFFQNQKNIDKAIEVCEFLILNGITDDDAKGFHVRLDDLYRFKRKLGEKGEDLSMASFPIIDEVDEEDD